MLLRGGGWTTGPTLYFNDGTPDTGGTCTAHEFCTYNPTTGWVDLDIPVPYGVWTKYTLEFNNSATYYNFYINDSLEKVNIRFRTDNNRNTIVDVGMYDTGSANNDYFDDFEIYNYTFPLGPTPDPVSITTTFNSLVKETTNEQFNITFQNYNLTSLTTADLTFNGTSYSGTIDFINQSYVTFTATAPIPIVYTNNSNQNLNWSYTLKFTNGTADTTGQTATETQATEWNLTTNPRVNLTALNLNTASYLTEFTIGNGSLNLSAVNGEVHYYMSAGRYELTFYNQSLQQKTVNITFVENLYNVTGYTYSLYTSNSINFTFLDEQTNNLITDANFTVEFISDDFSYNYTSSNGKLYVDLLSPEQYTIRYKSISGGNDYGRIRQYILNLVEGSHNELNLYALDNGNSTETTITTYKKSTINKLEGAIVYLQRYFTTDNTYKTVAMYSSDTAGNSYFDIEHDNEQYKFVVDYPFGTTKLTTDPFYISATTLNLYVPITEKATTEFFNKLNISYTLTYDAINSEFDLTYTDISNIATQHCLYLKKWGQYQKEIVNSSCSTSNSGSISLRGLNENKTYYGVYEATIGGENIVLASAWKTIFNNKLDSGTFGIFLTIILIITVVFVGALHVYSLILSTVILFFAELLNLINIGWGGVTITFIASLILAVIIQMKK